MQKKNEIKVISFLGKNKGLSSGMSDLELKIPSNLTAKIQECHLMLGHYILQQVEDKFLSENK